MNDIGKMREGNVKNSKDGSLVQKALETILKAGEIRDSKILFEYLVEELAKLLDIHWVTIARMDNEGFGELVAIASWTGDHCKEKFDYSINNTACEVLYNDQKTTHFSSNLVELFPDNHFYESNKVESYLGVPLKDHRGHLVGHLYLMDKKPLTLESWQESIVKLFAQTAKGELLRFHEGRKSRNFNQTLEKLVKSRTQKLFTTISELDTLFYKASHDLREPVVALKGISALLRDEMNEASATMDLLENQIKRLERLNVQLIDIGIIRKHEPVFTKLNLLALIKKVINSIPECSFDYIDFAFPENTEVQTDEKMLSIICFNLITNSIKYCLTDKPKIWISFQGSSLRFEDKSSGIPEKQVRNLTTMFFKAHTNSGAGLGLYKSRLAAEKINAKLYFESITGQGTKVWLELKDPLLI